MLTQHSPKHFTRNPVVGFLEVDKSCEDVFSILPRQFFWGVSGTRFRSLDLKIGSLESEKIGSLESETSGPYRSIPGT